MIFPKRNNITTISEYLTHENGYIAPNLVVHKLRHWRETLIDYKSCNQFGPFHTRMLLHWYLCVNSFITQCVRIIDQISRHTLRISTCHLFCIAIFGYAMFQPAVHLFVLRCFIRMSRLGLNLVFWIVCCTIAYYHANYSFQITFGRNYIFPKIDRN